MRFFQYNRQIVNLAHITHFTAVKYNSDKEDRYSLEAQLAVGENADSISMGTIQLSEVDQFKTEDEALRVAQEIVTGKYDLPTAPPTLWNTETPTSETIEVEDTTTTETPIPSKDTTDQTSEPEPEQSEPETVDEKVVESARVLFRLDQTEVIAKELRIDKLKIFGEAQRLWGQSTEWTTETWETYITALADFHQRKGTLYNSLKPTNGKGPF